MKKNIRVRNIDKFTGEKLISVQTWVPLGVYKNIRKLAKINRKTIKEYLREELSLYKYN